MSDHSDAPAAGNRLEKSDTAFRTISEVATDLDLQQHVLRFWETKFTQIDPMKRAGGRRYYRPEDVALLRRIKQHLYVDGMTIKGVQKLLRDPGGAAETPAPEAAEPAAGEGLDRADAERLLAELTVLRDDLRAALAVTHAR